MRCSRKGPSASAWQAYFFRQYYKYIFPLRQECVSLFSSMTLATLGHHSSLFQSTFTHDTRVMLWEWRIHNTQMWCCDVEKTADVTYHWIKRKLSLWYNHLPALRCVLMLNIEADVMLLMRRSKLNIICDVNNGNPNRSWWQSNLHSKFI